MSDVLSPGPAGAKLDLQSKLHEVVAKELNELSATIAAALSLELAPYFERLNLETASSAAEVRLLSEAGRTSCSTAVPSQAQAACEQPTGKGPKAWHLQGSEAEGLTFAQDEEARAQQSESELIESTGELYDLTQVFRALCAVDRASITVDDIIDMNDIQELVCRTESGRPNDTRQTRLTAAVRALNHVLGVTPTRESPERDAEVCIDTFVAIMQPKDELNQGLDSEVLRGVAEIRDILIQAQASTAISRFTNTSRRDLSKASRSQRSHKATLMDRVLACLDPFIGVVILLNALCISISTDVAPDSEAWIWLEAAFTLIFVAEFLLKLVAHGPCEVFLGADLAWNWFDGIIVLIATVDLAFTVIGKAVSLQNFKFIRLLRFLRLTRLVRVLQLKMFKELSLMVSGLLAGVRVLIWAMVFLGFILFSLGVLTTRTVGRTTPAYWLSICDTLHGADEYHACESSSEHLGLAYAELFGNVFRATFTIFRCFMGDCTTPDGTPLIPLFYNTNGILVVICFMVTTLFVNFGLFNLIMAIFVENTLDNAKRVHATRREAKYGEDVLTAVKLQRLVVAFCSSEHVPSKAEQKGPSRWRSFAAWVRGRLGSAEAPEEEGFGMSGLLPARFSTSVSQTAFNEALRRKDVQDILEELEIDTHSRHGLFDIIDGSANGYLEVDELVQGIIKLRGSEAKGDAVACLLAIRSVQKSIKVLGVLCTQHQQAIQRIEVEQQGLSRLKALPRRALEPPGPEQRPASAAQVVEGAPQGAARADVRARSSGGGSLWTHAVRQDALGSSWSGSAGAAPEAVAASGAAADAADLPQEVQAALAERGLPPSAARLKWATLMEEVWTIDAPSSP